MDDNGSLWLKVLENEARHSADKDGQAYVAPAELGAGNWNIRMKAEAQDGTLFEQRVILRVER